jgi:hypothetical protein
MQSAPLDSGLDSIDIQLTPSTEGMCIVRIFAIIRMKISILKKVHSKHIFKKQIQVVSPPHDMICPPYDMISDTKITGK